MTTTWNATATVTQSEQLANAYASFTLRTGSSSGTHTIATATSYDTLPSVVLTESAWLSPGSGGSGSLNGNTHAGELVAPSGCALPSGSGEPLGMRTRASWGSASLGSSSERGSTVTISPPSTGVGALTTSPLPSSGGAEG